MRIGNNKVRCHHKSKSVFRVINVICNLKVAIVALLLGVSTVPVDSQQLGQYESLNRRLIKLAPTIDTNDTEALEKFVHEAAKQNYGPAFYLLALTAETDEEILRNTLFALREGVSSAALVALNANLQKLPESERKELIRLAVENLEKMELSGRDLAGTIKALLLTEDLKPGKQFHDIYFQSLQKMARRGSPLAIGLILELGDPGKQERHQFCSMLETSGVLPFVKQCHGDVESKKGKNNQTPFSAAEYIADINNRLSDDNKKQFSRGCSDITPKFNSALICADILNVAELFCIIHSSNIETSAVNGINICGFADRPAFLDFTERQYQRALGVDIFEAKK